MMKLAHLSRLLLLTITLGGVLITLEHVTLGNPFTTAGNLAATTFDFPTDVPLTGWQLQSSRPTSALASLPVMGDVITTRDYFYQKHDRQDALSLEVKMSYIANITQEPNGDVPTLIQGFTSLPSAASKQLTIKQQPDVGFYGLFTHAKTAYLSSCINAQGVSTVTKEQFLHNRLTADLQPARLFRWMQGQAPLRDKRCLWVLMSTPLQATDPAISYSALEAAWFSWYEWWKTRFPSA
jgi:cyanosortase A-associated protein